jgi:uncharacterized membrane protein YeaQ/YmgE (transglycosylase-associated protein family)
MQESRAVVVEEVVMVANLEERGRPRALASRWPVDWSAVWVGALSAVVLALIIGLIGVAVGANRAPDARIVRWSDFGVMSLIFAVVGAFASFVVGGWVAGRTAGFSRSEPAILHGVIAWLLGVSLIVGAGSLGATSFGPWYRGIVPVRGTATATSAVEDPDAARAARNAALGALTAMLLGLVGAVVGGWMASGEPMTLTHYQTRKAA